jgi:hypothetical protein
MRDARSSILDPRCISYVIENRVSWIQYLLVLNPKKALEHCRFYVKLVTY